MIKIQIWIIHKKMHKKVGQKKLVSLNFRRRPVFTHAWFKFKPYKVKFIFYSPVKIIGRLDFVHSTWSLTLKWKFLTELDEISLVVR